MTRIIQYLFVAALLVGLGMGVGYPLYCRYLSGSSVGKFTVFECDVKSIGLADWGLSVSSEENWHTPISIPLSPDMNPIGFNTTVKGSLPTGSSHTRKSSRFKAELSREGEVLWQESFGITIDKKRKKEKTVKLGSSSQTEQIKVFSAPVQSNYAFQAEPLEPREVPVSRITLDVRRNIVRQKNPIVLVGVILIIVPLIGLAILAKKKQRGSDAA